MKKTVIKGRDEHGNEIRMFDAYEENGDIVLESKVSKFYPRVTIGEIKEKLKKAI